MMLLFIVIGILTVLLVVTLCVWQSKRDAVDFYENYVLPRNLREIERLNKELAACDDWESHLIWHPDLRGVTEDGTEYRVSKPMIVIKADKAMKIEGKVKLVNTAERHEDSGEPRVLREIELPFAAYLIMGDRLKLHYDPKQHA